MARLREKPILKRKCEIEAFMAAGAWLSSQDKPIFRRRSRTR